jgi:hypothetical protein
MNTRTKYIVLALPVLIALSFAVYSWGIGIQRYGDDFQFVFENPAAKIFYFFFHRNPENVFYRPVQSAFSAFTQAVFDLRTWPIHLIQITLHGCLAWLIFVVMRQLRFSPRQAMIGTGFALVAQSNVIVVLSPDSFSQISGVLCGCLSLWLVYLTCTASHENRLPPALRDRRYWYALVALVLALFSKESCISYLPMVVFLIFVMQLNRSGWLAAAKRSAILALPFIIATILYMMLRSSIAAAQPSFGTERYDFHIGANIIKNFLMLGTAGTSPVSTVALYTSLKKGYYLVPLIAGTAQILFWILFTYGCLVSTRWKQLSLFALFVPVSLFPVFLLNHVSEFYFYNALPFVAVLVGAGCGRIVEGLHDRTLVRYAIVIFLLIYAAGHITAVSLKSRQMQELGIRTTALLNQLEPYLREVPPDGYLLLINPAMEEVEYSVFEMHGFTVLHTALHRLNQISGRNDLQARVISPDEVAQYPPADSLFLTLKNSELIELHP